MELSPIKIVGKRYPGKLINSKDFMEKYQYGVIFTDVRAWNMRKFIIEPGSEKYAPEYRDDTIIDRDLVYYEYKVESKPKFSVFKSENHNDSLILENDTTGISREFSAIKEASDIEKFSLKYGLLGFNSEHSFITHFDTMSEKDENDEEISKEYSFEIITDLTETSSKTAGYVDKTDWLRRPWIETADDWLHHSEKVRIMLNIYSDLKRGKETTYLLENEDKFDHVKPSLFADYSLHPNEIAIRAIAQEISVELSNKIHVGYSDVEESNTTPIGYRILETRTTKHLLAAIYYDLWRTITAFEPIYICNYCKRPLIDKFGRRVYCSNSCKQAAYRKRIKDQKKSNQ